MPSSNATGPVGVVLSRLEGARKSGNGYLARCPAHRDRSASLSVALGRNGACILKCFAGCDTLSVLHAIGLEMADLYPDRIADTSPEGRAAARQAWRESGWAAALNVLAREAAIVAIAATELAAGRALSGEDHARLATAIERIDGCREVLA